MNRMHQQPGLVRRPSQRLAAKLAVVPAEHEVVDAIALKAQGLSKCYRRYARQWDRVKQWISGSRHKYYTEHWALRDLNLIIPRGKTVGILGQNGSGKSTLLQLIAGTLTPSEGSLSIHGRVAALLELGSGFHPEFTGWENARLQAAILGLHEGEAEEKLQAIADFSELGEALDQPIRTYSSGMVLRLGFSIAISVDPEILLIDEALAVGDMRFQQKCMARIRQLREQGVTIVLVTHDIGTTKRLCDEAHVLDHGRLMQSGPTESVCNWYVAHMLRDDQALTPKQGERHGNQQAVIGSYQLLDANGCAVTRAIIGQRYTLSVGVTFNEAVQKPVLGFYWRDSFGTELFGTNTASQEKELNGKAGSQATVSFSFGLHVRPGAYTLCLGLVDYRDQPVSVDWLDAALVIEVHDGIPGRTVFGLIAEEIEVTVG